MEDKIQVCNRCVLDNKASDIKFDEDGICVHCTTASELIKRNWKPNSEGTKEIHIIASKIKREGKNKSYDAIIGLSGGVDSSYLAHFVVKVLKLKVLAVHVDSGWNTEKACKNIENLVRILDLDLYTKVINWTEMRELQIAFLRSGVINQDIPQDHSFFSTLYRVATKNNIKYFLSGVNLSSESVTIPDFGYPAIDGYHVKSVLRKFSKMELLHYPTMSISKYFWLSGVSRSLITICPLSYLNYDKTKAKKFLIEKYKFSDYGAKHSESRFTKFYQNYFLTERFGFDKRKLHLSSLIVSEQVTRQEALRELKRPVSTPHQRKIDFKFVAKKLRIEVEDLEYFIKQPIKKHTDYPNSLFLLKFLLKLKNIKASLTQA